MKVETIYYPDQIPKPPRLAPLDAVRQPNKVFCSNYRPEGKVTTTVVRSQLWGWRADWALFTLWAQAVVQRSTLSSLVEHSTDPSVYTDNMTKLQRRNNQHPWQLVNQSRSSACWTLLLTIVDLFSCQGKCRRSYTQYQQASSTQRECLIPGGQTGNLQGMRLCWLLYLFQTNPVIAVPLTFPEVYSSQKHPASLFLSSVLEDVYWGTV